MSIVDVSSLPGLLFAHRHEADTYHCQFAIQKKFWEIFYIAEGSLTLTVGSEELCAQTGDVVCLLHNAKTAVTAKKFHCHHTVGVAVEWNFASDEQSALLLPVITPKKNNTETLCRFIDNFIHNQMLYQASKALGSAKLLELFCEIDKCNRSVKGGNIPGELLYVRRAKSYIRQHLNAPITQRAIAEHLDISPEYLCTVFKKAEGTTIMRYINKIKLENVKMLMDSAQLHLYEAAALYGYNDPNYVSRLYKQLFGYNITDKAPAQPGGK